MIRKLVLFGATGDLAGRYLLPALAGLHATGRLPEGFLVVGASREVRTDDQFPPPRQAAPGATRRRYSGHGP